MPLVVHRSHRAEDLARELAEILAPAPDDPFVPDVVAVHSAGLESWLAMEIAKHNGICANVLFPRPNEVLAELAADALGEEMQGGWTAQRILWAMLASLDEAGPLVERYLLEDGPAEKTRRAVALFQSLARIFEAYGTYRPELVREWQNPRQDEPWEAPFWRAIEARLGACHLTAWEDRLAGRKAQLAHRGRLCFFSVSTLAPIVVRLLQQLSGEKDVHVFFLLASPGENHPLNASMAMLARDFSSTLSPSGAPPAPERSTLLRSLQADLVDDTVRPAETDNTIQVHICHSALRQVQVLKDALLTAFDQLPDLEPRDVLVLAPDVETFAPLVEAVFGTERNRLPYTLADRGVRTDNQAADALLQVLELTDSRFEATAVLELLTLEPVRERFGLAAEDMPRVREMLVESGARWGRDAAHRVAWDMPDDDRFTWRFAMERLLLGQALADPDRTSALGHAPDCDFEGKDDRRILGGLVDLVETLLSETAELVEPRTPEQWFARLSLTADRMLCDDPDRPWRKRQVLSVLRELGRDAGDLPIPLDLRTIRAVLQGRFTTREPGRGFLAGAITISELVPLRSIPFRVVCLVGIDEGGFPRIETRPGYDRIAADPRRGDRSARSDDRALFVEAILSARDRLIVTCTGRSDRTGRDVPLAVPVVELLDVLEQMGAKNTVRRVPLHPWAPELFAEGASHDANMAIAARAWGEGRTNPTPIPKPFAESLPEEPLDQMTLAELLRFWRHPPSELVKSRLRISLHEESDDVLGTLPTALDGLERWKIGDALLQDPASASRFLRGATVGLGTPGRIQVEHAQESIAIVRALLERHRGDPIEPRDVDFFVGGVRLTGRVADLTTKGRVIARAGKVRAQHRLEAWIAHLALHVDGWRGTTTILGTSDCKVLDPVDDAHEHLATLLEWTRLGRREPLLFWPDVSHAALEAFETKQSEWSAYYASDKSWEYRADNAKTVDRWVLADRNPFHPDVDDGWPRTIARAVWTPVWKHEREVTE
jgi:exodeoxyribonuclease V gamma subunit